MASFTRARHQLGVLSHLPPPPTSQRLPGADPLPPLLHSTPMRISCVRTGPHCGKAGSRFWPALPAVATVQVPSALGAYVFSSLKWEAQSPPHRAAVLIQRDDGCKPASMVLGSANASYPLSRRGVLVKNGRLNMWTYFPLYPRLTNMTIKERKNK